MSKNKNEKRKSTQKLYKINAHKQTGDKPQDDRQLKDRFLEAVVKGELGSIEISGAVVTLKEFKAFFSDITTQYVSSFMPAATFEPGRFRPTHTKFLFRIRKGAYLIHSDVLVAYMRLMLEQGSLMEADVFDMSDRNQSDDDPSVKEQVVCYWV